MKKLTELSRSRELITNLTLRELRGKYKRSVLGWTWSVLNPVSTMLVYTLVFTVIFKAPVPTGNPSGLKVFPLFLLCGLLPWNFLANSVTSGMEALVANGNLIKKVYFPREILVIAIVNSWAFSLCIELGLLVVALLVAGNMVLPWLPLVLVVMAVQFAMTLGLALLFSVLNVYFRDTRHLMGIAMQMWFYLTPIIYPISFVTDHDLSRPLRILYFSNPMAHFAQVYRNLLYDLRFPAWGNLAYITASAAVILSIGAFVFGKLEGRLAEEL